MFVQNYPVWDHLCNYCATAIFALKTQKMDHHNENSPTSLFERVLSAKWITSGLPVI